MKYGLKLYEKQNNILDPKILEKDEITFSVLRTIMNSGCERVFTDGEKIIICYSCSPWPVWIWADSSINSEEITNIRECLRKEFPLKDGYSYNLSYELLVRLQSNNNMFSDMKIKTNLLSFCCKRLNELEQTCDGHKRLAKEADLPLVAKHIHDFTYETQSLVLSENACIQNALDKISTHSLFVWENETNEIVAMAAKVDDDENSKVTLVYTIPEARRKGYAINLVYQITKAILENNKLPILYTDADYIASNECYKKIGYEIVGELYTVTYHK